MARLSLPTHDLAPYPTRKLLGDLWGYVRPYRTQFFTASILRLVSDVANLYPPIASSIIITQLSLSLDPANPMLWRTFQYWVGAALIGRLTINLAKYLGIQVSERAALDAQRQTLDHLVRLDANWQEKENSGNKLKRIERGGDSIMRLLRLWVNSFIEIAVNLVGVMIIVGSFDRFVAALLVVFALVFSIISAIMIRPASQASRLVNKNEEHFIGVAYELIANIRTVKVLGMATGLFQRIDDAIATLFRSVQNRVAWFQGRNAALGFWIEASRLSILAVVIYRVLDGSYEVGFIVLVAAYFGRINEFIRELSDNAQEVVIARDGVGRMQDILNEPITIDHDRGKVAFPAQWSSINLTNVRFSYDANAVLKDLTLSIARGEKIGIVGRSGAGKSTLFKLLLKEHESFRGVISIDDTPIQSIKPSSYFGRAAVVLQDTEVFNLSLRDNIVLANPSQSRNALLLDRAIKIAHVSDFINKLPRGVDTMIGEKGIKLSGGERQRLGIARAVFKEPEILFLDEATSHLDSESELKIRDSLHQFFQGVTAIVIAHRLSTIKEMDRILVLEKGQIVEDGSFSQLHRKKGTFYKLWETQKL